MQGGIYLKKLPLAFLSSVLLFFAFPRYDIGILVWVGLIPLLIALEGRSLKRAFSLSYLTGLIFFAATFYGIWVGSVRALKPIHFILLAAYFSLYWGIWGLSLVWIRKKTGISTSLVAPPLWVAVEYIRSHVSILSYPWLLLGHTQYLHPSLIQITSITGVYGLTFLIVLMNTALSEAVFFIRRRVSGLNAISLSGQRFPHVSLIAASLLLISTTLYGVFVLSKGIQGDRLSIALVQGNIPQSHKWDRSSREAILDRHAILTRSAAEHRPDLIIWPETAVPGDVQHDPELKRRLGQIAMGAKSYLLVGSSEHAKFANRKLKDRYYNSMVLFSPEGRIEGEYKKIRLVPYAEFALAGNLVDWPKAIASEMGNYVPGDEYTLFKVGKATFGSVICWENIFPGLVRKFVKRGAQFMVIATNEAWFGDTAAPDQLLALSAFRAAENRVAIARAANTGISAFIDPFGRVTERLKNRERKDLFIEGTLIGDVVLSHEKTFYTQHGDLFAFLQVVICTLMIFLALIKGRFSILRDTR
jgi:apolipoprotein N-acyltransferase